MANAWLVRPLIPASVSVYGGGPKFDFSGGVLPAGATIARASSGSFTASNGLVGIAAANIARFEWQAGACLGLLVEPQRTNYVLNSEQIDSASYSRSSGGAGAAAPVISANYTSAPDGTATAERAQFNAGSTGGYSILIQGVSGPATTSTVIASVFSKGVGDSMSYMQGDRLDVTVIPATPGYFRHSFMKPPSASGSVTLVFGTYPGAPINRGGIASDIQPWGFQVEEALSGQNTSPTSYIPTTSAAATRAADILTLNWASKGVGDATYTARYTFDDGSTQDLPATVSGGTATISATSLSRYIIRSVELTGSASPPDVGASVNVLNDYAGIIVQVSCSAGAANEATISVDMGANVAIDTMLLFGVELFPTTGTMKTLYATAAQGNFTGAFSTDTTGAAYAGSAAMISGKGVSLWSSPTPVTARYWQFVFAAGAGVTGKSLRASRLVIGKRIQLERNFSYGAGYGVRDLGSLDFTRRAVLIRQRGSKLRTVSLTFSNVRKDEVEASVRPLLGYLGNTEMVALLTDPVADNDRQNRAYYGALVGDLGDVRRNSAAFEVKINQVSIF